MRLDFGVPVPFSILYDVFLKDPPIHSISKYSFEALLNVFLTPYFCPDAEEDCISPDTMATLCTDIGVDAEDVRIHFGSAQARSYLNFLLWRFRLL
jgi:hypothetical protein